ncbi:hypothetical protein [Lysinibacillus sphaericus]|uniref:hypothetical protein n=1 Tax=Lysinibacillus sphaericus TaxID=1421 RepID=UPI003D048ABC
MQTIDKQAVLDVLNSLEVIEQNGGENAYLLVGNNVENHKKLNALGVPSKTINNYGDEETFCILALALSEGYADYYNAFKGGLVLEPENCEGIEMNKQIIGANLDLSFPELKISATKVHETEKDWLGVALQVWEMEEREYQKFGLIEEDDWKQEYGWWRNAGCNHTGKKHEFIVKGHRMIGFAEDNHYLHDREYYALEDGEELPQIKFENLHEYLENYIGISKHENYTYFVHSLAEINGLTKAEIFKRYW